MVKVKRKTHVSMDNIIIKVKTSDTRHVQRLTDNEA